jgi:hypothetical protein
MIFLLIAAALVAGAPLVASVLVSVASLREDAAKSLTGRPPGPVARAARRLLQARVGGSGSQQHPRRVIGPRRPADDERATGSYDAMAAPRG